MENSGKLRFYKLDHESKIRLLTTHSHTSNGQAAEPGTLEEKQLKETQILQQGKPPLKNPPGIAGVAGGGRKGSSASQPQTVMWQNMMNYLCEKPGDAIQGFTGHPAVLRVYFVVSKTALYFGTDCYYILRSI